jgi:hypothetical protein
MRKAILPGLILVICVTTLILFGCKIEPPTRVMIENEWPRIYLVNVPPDSSQLPHAPIVYWYGADPDGYIVAYHWAIDDTTTWKTLDVDSVLGTEDTIAFSAPLPDTEYAHVFYVRALDNDGAVTIADSIARRVFRVTNIPPVNTVFEEHPDTSITPIPTVFVIEDTIATWHGIYFEWSTVDSDQVFPPKFSWSWDGGAWSAWDEATEKYFTGDDDPALRTSGQHTLRIRAMDDAMAVDSSAAPFVLRVSMPTFAKRLLVIDETRNAPSPGPGLPSDAQVDSFYDYILNTAGFGGYDSVDNSEESYTVSHDTIGQYRMIFLHSDDIVKHTIPEAQIFEDYLNVGGRLFLGGYQVLSSLAGRFNTRTYLGVDSSTVNGTEDFVGAIPTNWTSYPYLEVDTSKLVSVWGGAVPDVGVWRLSNIFNGLYAYDSRSDSVDFEGQAAVLFRFDYDEDDVTTFKAAASAFHLYSIKTDQSGQPLADVIGDILRFLEND